LFPGAPGLISFSHVGFDSTLREATVSTAFVCGRLCGTGSRYVLKKIRGHWEVVNKWVVCANTSPRQLQNSRAASATPFSLDRIHRRHRFVRIDSEVKCPQYDLVRYWHTFTRSALTRRWLARISWASFSGKDICIYGTASNSKTVLNRPIVKTDFRCCGDTANTCRHTESRRALA
jgi:hypothetical protein